MITVKNSLETERGCETITRLLEERISEEGVALIYSLYHASLKCGGYYFISVEIEGEAETSGDVMLLGRDRFSSERIFWKLVRGSVTPSTLREIVFDLAE